MIPKRYQQHFIEKQDERREMFSLLEQVYSLRSGLYPGSFVHITPSFYIPEMVYIDNDRRISKFFNDPAVFEYVVKNKIYESSPQFKGIQGDYSKDQGLEEGYFDAVFSFYAGFISVSCKKYLRSGGILVANNSHGDASMAITDEELESVGVVLRRQNKFNLQSDHLDPFLEKHDDSPIDMEKVKKRMVGERFKKSAFAYVFRKL